VSRVVFFKSHHSASRQGPHYSFHQSLTERLELPRENSVRLSTLRLGERYRARAELYRIQAEEFSDPKARVQLLQLATERRYGPRNLNLGDRKTDRRDFGPGALQTGPGNGQGPMLASALVECL
jgi:hypothetical protein